MKVIATWIVYENRRWQLLYQCENNTFFQTTNGAFNQRDIYVESVSEENARKLIADSQANHKPVIG